MDGRFAGLQVNAIYENNQEIFGVLIAGYYLFIAIFLVPGSPFPPILDGEPQAHQSEGEETRATNDLRGLARI